MDVSTTRFKFKPEDVLKSDCDTRANYFTDEEASVLELSSREDNVSGEERPFRRREDNIPAENSFSVCQYFKKGSRSRKMAYLCASFLLLTALLSATIVPYVSSLSKDDSELSRAPLASMDSNLTSEGSSLSPLLIGAFNIRSFGRSLMRNQEVVSSLVNIIHRYDIILIQEVRDSSQTSLPALNDSLTTAQGESWDFVASQRLGRSRYKEQYAYFYKPRFIKVIATYQVADSSQDIYEREPFAIDFEYTSATHKNSKQRVVLLGLHSKPSDAEVELRELSRTMKEVADVFSDSLGVIALGDFNADCSYLNRAARGSLDIFNSREFVSLIPESADSTVSRNTDCAYDRVVVYSNSNNNGNSNSNTDCYPRDGVVCGGKMAINVGDGAVFYFDSFFNIGEDLASNISDHYPVEFSLY